MAPRKKIRFSDLTADAVFEILLAFVAIDWDGPFTLTLVCTKWRDFVISHPRLWTWIKVDDTQADWQERAEISAYLSKELPLQICLRIPFTSTSPMAFITRRCTTLIVEPHSWHHSDWAKLWPDVFQDTGFWEEPSEEQRQSVVFFLRDAPQDQVTVLHRNGSHQYSYHPVETVYNDYMAGKPLDRLIMDAFPYSLTALMFNAERGERLSAPLRLQLSQLWGILPSFPHLGYLEVSNDIVSSNQDVAMSPLTLPSLQSVVLISLVRHNVPFSFTEDTWLGLFSLLCYLEAPKLVSMRLHGSMHMILAVMTRETLSIRPSDLIVEISGFNAAVGDPVLKHNPAWFKLVRFTIRLPASESVLSYVSDDATVCLLLFFVPRTCAIQVCSDTVLIAPLELQHILEDKLPRGMHLSRLRSLAAAVAYSCGSIFFQTRNFTERVEIEGQQLVTKSLNLYADWWPGPPGTEILTHIVDVRGSPAQIETLILSYDLRSLRALTLLDGGRGETPFEKLVSTLVRRANTLPRLTTIFIEVVYAWRPLIELLGNFGKAEGRGISTLNLPYLPHPSILQEIMLALNSGCSGYSTRYLDRDRRDSQTTDGPSCWECIRSRRACFSYDCTNPPKNRIISITKDSTWLSIDG